MRTITLHGDIGKKFGESYCLDVKSPAEAVRALCVLIKGFKQYLLDSEKNNLGFKVFDAENLLAAEDLTLFGSQEIKIVPIIGGASAGARILAGVVLIAVGYLVPATASYTIPAGIGLVLGGAIELIAGKPKIPNVNASEQADNKASYLFSGPVNTTAQGHAVPVGYGRMIIGSAVISASITNQILNGGYVWKVRNATKIVWATGTENGYDEPPPKDWTSRVLLSTGTGVWSDSSGTPFSIPTYEYQFTYPDHYLELAAV